MIQKELSKDYTPSEAERAAAAATLLEKARQLVPALRERASQTDELRTLPPETIDDLRKAGLLCIQKPAQYGGLQLGYDVLTDALAEIARGCASTAWVAMILNSAGVVAGFPEQAQEELWGDGVDRLVCGIFSPVPVKAVEGGYLLSGSWPFGSGIDYADWLFLGGLVVGQGRPEMYFFLLPKQEIQVIDDWYVAGLRGTGSKQIRAEQVFVPAHRALPMTLLREGKAPGADLYNDWLYHVPLAAVYHTAMVAPALGIARMAYGQFLESAQQRKTRDGQPVARQADVQIHLAECAAEIDTATTIIRTSLRETLQRVQAGEELPVIDRVRNRRDAVFACSLCVRAVDRIFSLSGAAALRDDNPLQRAWRDIHAVAAHHSNRWDDAMKNFGQLETDSGPLASAFY